MRFLTCIIGDQVSGNMLRKCAMGCNVLSATYMKHSFGLLALKYTWYEACTLKCINTY